MSCIERKLDKVMGLMSRFDERLSNQEGGKMELSQDPSAHSSPDWKRKRSPSFVELC